MSKKIINTVAVLFLIHLSVFSQSSDALFRYADSIKNINGEESIEYLDALSIAIQTTSDEGHVNKAYNYRKYHSEIIAKKYGEYSKEYANDMFRLGNISTSLNFIDTANYYYTKCIKINENIIDIDTLAYLNSIVFLANNYFDQEISNPTKDFDNPKYKLNLAEKLFEDLFYKIDEYKVDALWKMYNVDALWHKVNAKFSIGHIQLNKSNYEASIENLTYAANNALQAQDTLMYVNANWGLYLSYDRLSDIYQESNPKLSHEYLLKEIYHYELVYYDKNINDKYKQSFSYNDLSILYSLLSINYAEYNADYYNAILYCQKSADLLLLNEGEKSERYLSEMIELMRLYSTINNYSESLKISEHIYDKIVHASKDDILLYLNTSMSIYANTGQLEEFDKASKEYAEYVGAFFAHDPSEIVGCIINISLCYITLNKTEDAVNLIDGCIDFVNRQNEVDRTYLAILYTLKGSAIKFTNMNEAVLLLDKALEICHDDGNYNLMLSTMIEKGFVYHEYGYMQEALNVFHECIEICKIVGFDNYNNTEYLKIINNISVCNIGIGNYAEAILLLNEVAKGIEELLGKNNINYIQTKTNIIFYYISIGDYSGAINESFEVIKLTNETVGSETNQWTSILKNNLSFAYMNIGDYGNAKNTALSCAEIMKSLYGETSEKLSAPYLNCALSSYFLGEVDECIEYFDKSLEILSANKLSETKRYVGVLVAIAKLLIMENSPEAEPVYEEAITFLKSDNSLDITTLAEYYHSKIIADCKIDTLSISFINKKLEQLYLDNIVLIKESERNSYLMNVMAIEYINNVILSIGLDNKHNDELYDFVLKTKGIQLQTTNEINNTIVSSGNQKLIDDWDKLKHIKQTLLRNDSKDLRKQADELERSVLKLSKELSEYTQSFNTGWEDVRNALKENDVAIEFISYINIKSLDTIYGAFLLRKEWNAPKYIELCNSEQILKAISDNPSKLYSKDMSYKLYKNIWKPLEKYLNNNDNIYFSPSGIIHTISIESLYDDNDIMLEYKYNMYRTSTTKHILVKQNPLTYKSATIYGGLIYETDTSSINIKNTCTKDSILRSGWKYLYGTKEESDEIAFILRQSNIKVDLYQDYKGSEFSFKNLSSTDVDIIHIATHGFFLNDENPYINYVLKEVIRNINDEQYVIYGKLNDPLYRSGLIMAGGNKFWQNKEKFNNNEEDGILTSTEISLLDFSNTDLVVLSACETALGNITLDGVWGLQRAFKKAGVNTIIMSLWEVDDDATSYFMVSFYKQLLDGSSKRDAFNTAKKLTREKYKDPYYWAAFIMLD